MPQVVLNSAKTVVYINSKLYGQCVSLNYDIATPRTELRTVDIIYPVELIMTGTSCKGNMVICRTIQDGGIQGAGLVAPQNLLTKEKYFSITVIDRSTDSVLFQGLGCSVDFESWSITSKSLMTGKVNFSCIFYSNEYNPQVTS